MHRLLVPFAALLFGIPAWFNLFPGDPAITVRASGYRTVDRVETWPPENAVDRDELTYWHLPPGKTGYLELLLHPAKRVRAIRVLNGHDNHVRDPNRADRRPFRQAARQIRIRAFSQGNQVFETQVELSQIGNWERTTIPIGMDGIERIRIEIESFYGDGGGLAEVEVLE